MSNAQQLISERFQELVSSGMEPNAAAAQALLDVRSQISGGAVSGPGNDREKAKQDAKQDEKQNEKQSAKQAGIDMEELEALVRSCEETGDFTKVRRKIGSVVAPDVLNASFWSTEKRAMRQASELHCLGSSDKFWVNKAWYKEMEKEVRTLHCHNVDTVEMEKFYSLLLKCSDASVVKVTMAAIDRALMEMEMRTKNPTAFNDNEGSLRQFFIHLMNPMLIQPEYHPTLRRLCNSIAHLPYTARSTQQ